MRQVPAVRSMFVLRGIREGSIESFPSFFLSLERA